MSGHKNNIALGAIVESHRYQEIVMEQLKVISVLGALPACYFVHFASLLLCLYVHALMVADLSKVHSSRSSLWEHVHLKCVYTTQRKTKYGRVS